jgi:anthranilate 1,2-dioxygenase large subunit
VVQQILNTLATRQILPKAPDAFELVFTFFGYEDDDEDMRRRRIKQANFVGPAGYISMEDGYAAELEQQAIARDLDACSFLELDGTGAADAENLVIEAAMRGFWQYYREIMGF